MAKAPSTRLGKDAGFGRTLDFKTNVDQLVTWAAGTDRILEEIEKGEIQFGLKNSLLNATQRDFHRTLDMRAAMSASATANHSSSAPNTVLGKLGHLYRWGHVGEADNRLVRLIFPQQSRSGQGPVEGYIQYFVDNSRVPYRGGPDNGRNLDGQPSRHVFTNKAKIMEEFDGVWITPKSKPYMKFWTQQGRVGVYAQADDENSGEGGWVTVTHPVFVTFPNNNQQLHNFFIEYFNSGLVQRPLNEVKVAVSSGVRSMMDKFHKQIRKLDMAITSNLKRSGRVQNLRKAGANDWYFEYKGQPFTMSQWRRAIGGDPTVEKAVKVAVKDFIRVTGGGKSVVGRYMGDE